MAPQAGYTRLGREDIQAIPAGEIGHGVTPLAGAEGATARETLRQADRGVMKLWKADARARTTREGRISPKG